MWAISFFAACTVMLGCIMGERDEAAVDRWLIAPTEAECVSGNEGRFREVVAAEGDTILSVRVLCAPVGT